MRGMPIKIVAAVVVIIATVSWLAYTGVRDTKSYYVTIGELNALGSKAYSRNLRVAGNVAPGSIERAGTGATFVLVEQGRKLRVQYQGSEPPPDTSIDTPLSTFAYSSAHACARFTIVSEPMF